AAVAESLVYASLPSGTLSPYDSVLIVNLRTGAVATPSILLRGFDPVAITAVAGDTLDVALRTTSGKSSHTRVRVPASRPPRVIRTSPPTASTGIVLETVVAVVFSEPLDSTTL